MIVYVLWYPGEYDEGEGSLYAVFEDDGLAKEMQKTLGGDLDEMDTNALQGQAEAARQGMRVWYLAMDRHGKVGFGPELWWGSEPQLELELVLFKEPRCEHEAARIKRWKDMPGLFLSARVVARDQQHAIEVVDEHRKKLIAAGHWSEDWFVERKRREKEIGRDE